MILKFIFQVALSTVLEKRTQDVVLKDVSENSWVKLNPGTVSSNANQLFLLLNK